MLELFRVQCKLARLVVYIGGGGKFDTVRGQGEARRGEARGCGPSIIHKLGNCDRRILLESNTLASPYPGE